MNSEKMTARIVGVLFIVASAAPILTYLPLAFIIDKAPGYLSDISAKETQVMIGVLFELIWALAVLGIPIMLFPILKKFNEAGAIGFLGLRFIESVVTILYTIGLLSLVSLSREFVQAGTPVDSHYQVLGELLLAARDWAAIVGPGLVFALSAVVLNYILYQSQLVPRWLSAWGLLGGTLMAISYLAGFFSIDLEILFVLIAVQEMALAVWLIVKGFNSSVNASES
jgi:hypothetical protein